MIIRAGKDIENGLISATTISTTISTTTIAAARIPASACAGAAEIPARAADYGVVMSGNG